MTLSNAGSDFFSFSHCKIKNQREHYRNNTGTFVSVKVLEQGDV